MTSVEQIEPKNEIDLTRESIKCLAAVALCALAVYGLYSFIGPLMSFAGAVFDTIFPAIGAVLKIVFASDTALALYKAIGVAITVALDFGVSIHLFVQPALLLLGLWASCVGVKLINAGQKFDVSQKLERVTFWLFFAQAVLFMSVDMYAYVADKNPMFFVFGVGVLIQLISAGCIESRCIKIRLATKENHDAEQTSAA
jgi:hypothetical protein